MKKVRISIIISLSAICLIAASKSDDDYFEISKNLRIMASVYEKLNSNYVDELLPGKVMKTGINAMLKSLDPYTVYISESEIESKSPVARVTGIFLESAASVPPSTPTMVSLT